MAETKPNPLSVVAAQRVLNVGGGASRKVPDEFSDWEQDLLDIDPEVHPDILCDALKLDTLPAETYDGVMCSHNLEHFYEHDVPTVLKGFLHVLKPGGKAVIVVPNVSQLIRAMNLHQLDIGDVWYRTADGNAITFHDVLYGWGPVIRQGNLYYAHKCCFTRLSLQHVLALSGFAKADLWEDAYNLYARAFKGAVPCH